MVELNGLAVGPYTMIAPITQRSCYYYRTVAWEWKRSGRSSQWVKVAVECMHVPFFLDDNSGKVMVDPRGAELELHRDFQEEFCDSFFTTKEAGKGTGLGLATVYGIVKQSKGHLSVYSEVGVGTTFKVYLPAVEQSVSTPQPEQTGEIARGHGTILLVEDEVPLRALAAKALERSGYHILQAGSGLEALVVADRPPGRWNHFHIIMTGDLVTARLNDQLVVDTVPLENYWQRGQPLPMRGPIELQAHGGPLEFRNIFIRELH